MSIEWALPKFPVQAGPGWPRLAQLGSGHFCSILTKKGYEKGPNRFITERRMKIMKRGDVL